MTRKGAKHKKHHHHRPKEEKKKEERDEELSLLDAYNFADSIQTDWEASAVPNLCSLGIQWVDTDVSKLDDVKFDEATEVASETESIEDPEVMDERVQALQEVDREEQLGGEPRGDEDLPESDETEDIEDFYMWPKYMDSIVYGLGNEVIITKYLMNKPERKVYFGRRKSDKLPVVVVVGKEFDPRLRKNGVPREIRIMLHLRGQKNVAEILGWCPVGKRHFVIVLRHYQSADMIESSAGNLFIISKMMESSMQALKQVHDNKVVHRDVAKSNLLWNPVTDTAIIIDFDNSCFFRQHGYYKDVGRDKYDAPEKTEMLEIRRKLKEKLEKSDKKHLPSSKIKKRMYAYTEKADIYSLGVLMWMLLNQEKHSPSPRKLKDWIDKVKQRNRHKKYVELDLLLKLLNYDPDRRISLEDALQHPFITERPDSSPDPDYAHMKAYLFKKLNMDADCDDEEDDPPKEEQPTRPQQDEKSSEKESSSEEEEEDDDEEKGEEQDKNSENTSRLSSDPNDSDDDEEEEEKDDDEKDSNKETKEQVQEEEKKEQVAIPTIAPAAASHPSNDVASTVSVVGALLQTTQPLSEPLVSRPPFMFAIPKRN